MLSGWFIHSCSKHALPPLWRSPVPGSARGVFSQVLEAAMLDSGSPPPTPQVESSPTLHHSMPTRAPRQSHHCLVAPQTLCEDHCDRGGQGEDPLSLVNASHSVWTSPKGLPTSTLREVSSPGLISCVPVGTLSSRQKSQ